VSHDDLARSLADRDTTIQLQDERHDEMRQRVTELQDTANRLAALHALEHRALMEKYNA